MGPRTRILSAPQGGPRRGAGQAEHDPTSVTAIRPRTRGMSEEGHGGADGSPVVIGIDPRETRHGEGVRRHGPLPRNDLLPLASAFSGLREWRENCLAPLLFQEALRGHWVRPGDRNQWNRGGSTASGDSRARAPRPPIADRGASRDARGVPVELAFAHSLRSTAHNVHGGAAPFPGRVQGQFRGRGTPSRGSDRHEPRLPGEMPGLGGLSSARLLHGPSRKVTHATSAPAPDTTPGP
jgi:hypothetical protein